jgi:hypothetical protein
MSTRPESGGEHPSPGLERRSRAPDLRPHGEDLGIATEPAARPRLPASPAWTPSPGAQRGMGSLSPRGETGAAMERQLLLESGPGEDSFPGGSRDHWPRITAALVVLGVLLGTGIYFFVQVRGHWKSRASLLETELSAARSEASEKEERYRREAADRDRVIAERRAENQGLAALAGKTVEELQIALADLRKAREENAELESELRKSLRSRSASLKEELLQWIADRWVSGVRPVPASGPVPDEAAPPAPQDSR